jgi:hypothetical protein
MKLFLLSVLSTLKRLRNVMLNFTISLIFRFLIHFFVFLLRKKFYIQKLACIRHLCGNISNLNFQICHTLSSIENYKQPNNICCKCNENLLNTFCSKVILLGLFYKTFYGRNLRIFVIAFQVLHSRVGPWPFPQALEHAKKASQRQTL